MEEQNKGTVSDEVFAQSVDEVTQTPRGEVSKRRKSAVDSVVETIKSGVETIQSGLQAF